MTTLPEPVALQFWSHDKITPEIRAQIETILSGSVGSTEGQHAGNVLALEELPSASEVNPTATPSLAPSAQALSENPNIKQTPQGFWVLVNDSHISRWVEEHGTLFHDRQTLPLVLPEIPVGGTVIDVGAFIGDSTAPFLERVEEGGTVLAFEPNMDAWKCLKRNCPKAKCYPFALGAPGDPWLELAPNENAGARHLRKFGFEDENGPVVDIATLDSLDLDACDFIKIDVEGFELRVLKGAVQTINRFHPKMLIEVNRGALERQGATPDQIEEWLRLHGYQWHPVQPNVTTDSPQFDILCVPIAGVTRDEQPSTASLQELQEPKATIRSLAEQLKKFCCNSAQTRVVRLELHKQGVIELPYRFKRRGKWRKRKARA